MAMYNRSVRRRYVRDVRNGLACSARMKRNILSHIKRGVEEYLRQNPNADLEAVRTYFGTPQEIAANCVDGQETYAHMKKFRKKTRAITAAVMVTAILVCAGGVIWNVYLSQENTKGAVQHIKVETEYH